MELDSTIAGGVGLGVGDAGGALASGHFSDMQPAFATDSFALANDQIFHVVIQIVWGAGGGSKHGVSMAVMPAKVRSGSH